MLLSKYLPYQSYILNYCTRYNVQEQWLVTDISVEGVMERGVLPPNLTDNAKVILPTGRYPVQVLIFFVFPSVLWTGKVLMLIRIRVRLYILMSVQVLLMLENQHPGSADPNPKPAR
jgi:hypothetical protein